MLDVDAGRANGLGPSLLGDATVESVAPPLGQRSSLASSAFILGDSPVFRHESDDGCAAVALSRMVGIATAGDDLGVRLWNIETGKIKRASLATPVRFCHWR